jgi:pimeloyl-ACP methyl ester carboxylesterase
MLALTKYTKESLLYAMPAGTNSFSSALPVDGVARHEWRLDVSPALATGEALEVAASLVLPDDSSPLALLVCLPGGFLSRRYYDLEVDGDRSFSFAQHMAGCGYATLAFDHLGVGDSSRPQDGWLLDVDTLARANQAALETALTRWDAQVGARVPTIGVGHSMGSCLSVAQQARFAPHAALVLFSFTTAGLSPFLQGREAQFAGDPAAARANIVALARERFGSAYPSDEADSSTAAFSVGSAPPAAQRALEAAATGVLPIPGLLSMIPGGYTPWADEVRVPTFVAVGDHDLHGADEAAASLPNAPGVISYTLEDCWHCHNVANNRQQLWNRVARWLDGMLGADGGVALA